MPHPPRIQTYLPKSSALSKQPPLPVGNLRKLSPMTPQPPQKEVRKSLVYPNLKIPQTLPPLDLPPPNPIETLETYRPPNESLYQF